MYNYDGMGEAFAAFSLIFIFFIFIALIIGVINIIARWIFFNKCGEEGWKAIIPVYNEITLLKISGMNWWWIFILYAATIVSLFQYVITIIGAISGGSETMAIISLFFSLISIIASIGTIITKICEGYNLAKKFNKSGGYAALFFFFEPIMFFIFGLSSEEKYDEKVKVSPNGLFGN